MKGFAGALWAELLKARRSRVPLFIALGYVLLPFVMAFFMVIMKDPEGARRLGIIGLKAQILVGVVDWSTYLGMLSQGVMGLIILSALMGGWVFGREFADRTMKDLLALPTSRSAFIAAKYMVFAIWSLLMISLVAVLGVFLGYAVGLPGLSSEVILNGMSTILVVGVMNILLITPIALVAFVGRGYLPSVGFMFLALALAQISEVIGYGAFFPYAIPALFIKGSMGGDPLGAVSYLLVLLTCLGGAIGTYAWLRYADQT
ncbi:MAG: ABC transporter permease [Candidatus Bathyarchaeota archaeon]|nr:ABC transporter permease [Candidatus Bathyarchaeota archaeon]